MSEEIDAMRAWALSRIRQCRVDEQRFSRNTPRSQGVSDNAIRAVTERRALEAVLEQLGVSCPHRRYALVQYSTYLGKLMRCVVCGSAYKYEEQVP